MKKVEDIIRVMENIAPKCLKEDFDNVGLMVGNKENNVEKVLLALDCTLEVIEEAKALGVNLIVTHHPLIFRKPNSITTDSLLGRKIIELIKNDISVYSSHTNLDSVAEGLNETIVNLLGFKSEEIIEKNKNSINSKDGLGRIVRLEKEINVDDLIKDIKINFNIERLRVVNTGQKVRNLAIINGSGEDFIAKAVEKGVDCIITGDTTYHYALDYKELGVSIIDMGHFSSEWLVFLKVMEKLKKEFIEVEFFTSNRSRDPYTFV